MTSQWFLIYLCAVFKATVDCYISATGNEVGTNNALGLIGIYLPSADLSSFLCKCLFYVNQFYNIHVVIQAGKSKLNVESVVTSENGII